MSYLHPLPERLSGSIGLVLKFTPTGVSAIREQTMGALVPGMRPLITERPPHCTLSHAKVRDTSREALMAGLEAIRQSISGLSFVSNRITLIGGRFLVIQAQAPRVELQLAALRAALVLRPWLDQEAVATAISEGLSLSPGQAWCLQTFGHPLAMPDVEDGQFNRALHVSLGYWPGEELLPNDPEPHTIYCEIADVCLAQMGPLGVVEHFFDV